MKKITILLLLLLGTIPSSFAQLKTYTFEEAFEASKENPKPIVVFVHTNWCKYCKMMDNSTFKNTELIATLNKDFYFVKFDGETKENITINHHVYKYVPRGRNTGTHELAAAIATIDGQITYPTLVVLEDEATILFQKSSYLNAKTVHNILLQTKKAN
ncbi:thioredoxin family protein [Flavobacterium sp. 7A]|uniref:thioredoxin family protein n=1 Tax=Flavobacterium sp. 7A TaxID=2940571 RepID=UPI002226763A|nr:thioredoxin family protein [Flavobacterium sp. 7A]MCW2119306.1 thioredoxin-related protein [Flavobacterium sp. 7A]